MIAMTDAVLVTPRLIDSVCEVPLGVGVLHLLVPGVAVRGIINQRDVAETADVSGGLISGTPELFSEDDGVEF